MKNLSASPTEMICSFWSNRNLIVALAKREIVGRYRGSLIGILWSFFNPLLMLVIYTFVFSVAFNARWGTSLDESKGDFAVNLFVGLIVHGLFAECINRAPNLITANANYVKKVIFPLEIFPWIILLSALFHATISFLVLILVQITINHTPHLTSTLFPIVILPMILGTMGIAWTLAALGVYIRDTGQIANIFTTAMLFLSAVFFPASAIPEKYKSLIMLNPVALTINESRAILIHGDLPDFGTLGVLFAFGATTAILGFQFFQKLRRGFADVI